jgi:hypothetical protein
VLIVIRPAEIKKNGATVCHGHILGPSHIPLPMHPRFYKFAQGVGSIKKLLVLHTNEENINHTITDVRALLSPVMMTMNNN